MKAISIALAQINPAMGALRQNADLVLDHARRARDADATVVVFPELAISGYPPEDLIVKRHFVEDCQEHIERIAPLLPPDLVTIVGCPWVDHEKPDNAAVILHGGQVVGIYRKMLLPNYGVFDEKRVFQAGVRPMVIEINGLRLGIHICEDSWILNESPCLDLRKAHLDVLINLSASPYHRTKLDEREQVMGRAARFLDCPLLYCNMVGGQDELVFDGASMMLTSDGEVVARAKQFDEDLLLAHVRQKQPPHSLSTESAGDVAYVSIESIDDVKVAEAPSPRQEPLLSDLAEVYTALKVGLRDYVLKNHFEQVVIALSGGIDSALVATLAADALGPDRVSTVTMPSRYSSDGTRSDAEQLARNLGVDFSSMSIERIYGSFLEELQQAWPGRAVDTTEENIQARIRGTIIMALSNKFNHLVLATGNKSEMAVGYCTLYGDMAGGFAVIKDVPKTLVFALCRWRNEQDVDEVIPTTIIDRPPSAELRDDQKDTDSLPPYDVLDAILEAYVEKDMGIDEMVANGFDMGLVTRILHMVDLTEYKRRQAPPGIKITPKAFGKDRRLPITNAYREHTANQNP